MYLKRERFLTKGTLLMEIEYIGIREKNFQNSFIEIKTEIETLTSNLKEYKYSMGIIATINCKQKSIAMEKCLVENAT